MRGHGQRPLLFLKRVVLGGKVTKIPTAKRVQIENFVKKLSPQEKSIIRLVYSWHGKKKVVDVPEEYKKAFDRMIEIGLIKVDKKGFIYFDEKYRKVVDYIYHTTHVVEGEITDLGWEYSGSDYKKNFLRDFGTLPPKKVGALNLTKFSYHNQTVYGPQMYLQLSYEKKLPGKPQFWMGGYGIVTIIERNWNYEHKYTLHVFNDTGMWGIWTYGTRLLPKMKYDKLEDIYSDLSKVSEDSWKKLLIENKDKMKQKFASGLGQTLTEIKRFGEHKGPPEERVRAQIKIDPQALKMLKVFRGEKIAS